MLKDIVCVVRSDSNRQKWALVNGGSMRIKYEFEKKWVVLRSVKQEASNLVFAFDVIGLRINGRFDVSNRSYFHTESGSKAFGCFIGHIKKTYDGYSLAVCSFKKEVVENKLKNILQKERL